MLLVYTSLLDHRLLSIHFHDDVGLTQPKLASQAGSQSRELFMHVLIWHVGVSD